MSKYFSINNKNFFLVILIAVTTASFYCSKGKGNQEQDILKGKLVKEGLCRSYIIMVTDGNINPKLIDSLWTHPFSKIVYKNVFGVTNYCDFRSVKEGQEFYFRIIPSGNTDCVNCGAGDPTPEKKLNIQVLDIINN